MMNALESTSTRPYLIRALYEWCTDNGFTPYVAVLVDESVKVPREFVKDGEIVLNISFDATSSLQLGNEFIEFKARFGGTPRDIMVPIGRVMAIYARENGQGMAFPAPAPALLQATDTSNPFPADAGGPAGGLTVVVDGLAPADEDDAKVVQLVPADAPEATAADHPVPPRPAPGSGGSRPALKRVK